MSKRRREGKQMVDEIEVTTYEGTVINDGPLQLPTATTSSTLFIITRSEGQTTEDPTTWTGARSVLGGGSFMLTRINNQVSFSFAPSTLMSTPAARTAALGWTCPLGIPPEFIPTNDVKWSTLVIDNGLTVDGYFTIVGGTGVVHIAPISGAFAAGNCAILNNVNGLYFINQ